MRDLILIPTFARPEYLDVCLDHIFRADGGTEKEIIITHDRHVNDLSGVAKEIDLTRQVVAKWQNSFKNITLIVREPHPYIGNPCNFLEGYKAASSPLDVRYVYLIEDDVMVNKDFFTWHEAVQARGDYFVTVGWHCIRNPEVKPGTDPHGIIESTRDFSSIGICWKREKLEPLVHHAKVEFYRNMAGYLRNAFPGSPIPAGQWTEQAGVITRLLHETRDRWVAWPVQRRCSHVGVSGYHRPKGHRFAGELEDRVRDLKKAIYSDRIVGMSKDFVDDIEAMLEPQEWQPENIYVAQRFEYQPGKI